MIDHKKNFNRNMLFDYLEPILKYPYHTSYELFVNSINSLNGLIVIELFRRILVNLENGLEFSENYNLIIFLTLVTIFPPLLKIFTVKNEMTLFSKTNLFLSEKYMNKFFYLNNDIIQRYSTGKLVGIIKNGIDIWVDQLRKLYTSVIPHVVTYIFTIIILMMIDYRLIYPSLIFTLILGFFIYFVNRRTHHYRVIGRVYGEKLMHQFTKMIMEKFNILKNNKIETEQKVIKDIWSELYPPGLKKTLYLSILKLGTQSILDLVKIAFILWFGIYGLAKGMNISDIAIIMLLANMMSRYASLATEHYRHFSSQSQQIARMLDFYYNTPLIKGYNKGKKLEYKQGDILINNVKFKYNNQDKLVFDNFNLEIKGGKKTAFVGISGVGKSTLIKLILRFVDPLEGNIFIDNQNLHKISLKSYYKIIGYLSQDPSIFDGSVYENLTYGLANSTDVSDKTIADVLKKAECDFVFKLKDKLDTQIGEKGIRLSGGERQRLAIARLLLQDPKIIILDEPTSALDSLSELKITNALEVLCKGKTVLIIAHRLQTVKDADEIIVLGKNEIIERGTHKDLLKNNTIYSKMVDLQSGSLTQ